MTADRNAELLQDVPVRVTAEVGTSRMSIAGILKLGTGSFVTLDRPAGAAIDVLVNGKLLARGEIVAIDDRYGVRITELVRKH